MRRRRPPVSGTDEKVKPQEKGEMREEKEEEDTAREE